MISTASFFLLSLVATSLPSLTTSRIYNAPECVKWPDSDIWTDELSSMLSSDAAFHGPFADNHSSDQCETLGSDAFAISKAGNGICMHAHAYQREFCRPQFAEDLPDYVDIQKVLDFCKKFPSDLDAKLSKEWDDFG